MRLCVAWMEGKYESLGVVCSSIKFWVSVVADKVTKVNHLTNSDIAILNLLEIRVVEKRQITS